MPPKYKQLTVYPDPTARAIVGGNSPACNQAIECWAEMLRRHQPQLDRDQWNFLADVLNGTITMPEWKGNYLAAEVQDAQELIRSGDKWFGDGRGDLAVKDFLSIIQAWDYPTLQYTLAAIRFFWENHEEIDSSSDDWWTIPYRVRMIAGEGDQTK